VAEVSSNDVEDECMSIPAMTVVSTPHAISSSVLLGIWARWQLGPVSMLRFSWSIVIRLG
jgi:hypothetical protein